MARIGLSKFSACCLAGGLIACPAAFMLKPKPAQPSPDGLKMVRGESHFRSSNHSRDGKKPPRAGPDLQAVDRALLLASGSESDGQLPAIIRTLSQAEVLEVIHYLQGPGKPGSPKEQRIGSFIQAWATLDPDAALAWAARLPEWDRDSWYEMVCISAAAADPLKAIEAARESPDPAKTPGMIENLADQWATVDLPAAIRWAREQPEEENRGQMISRVALVQSTGDPVAAANLILAEIPPGEIQDEAAMTVIHQWALKNPVEARAWVETFPPSSLRIRAIAELDGIASVRQQATED